MERLGILGGSFDPPHMGHIALVEIASHQLYLDEVTWAPSRHPPHKRPAAAIHHRLAMTRLAIADQPHSSLCLLDVTRPGPHFTADLLELLRTERGSQVAFWFLVGQDSLYELASWHAPAKVLQNCRLAVMPRQGPPVDWRHLGQIVPGIEDKVDWLGGPTIELASTTIRHQIRQGQSITGRVPAAVLDYIIENRLYLD